MDDALDLLREIVADATTREQYASVDADLGHPSRPSSSFDKDLLIRARRLIRQMDATSPAQMPVPQPAAWAQRQAVSNGSRQ